MLPVAALYSGPSAFSPQPSALAVAIVAVAVLLLAPLAALLRFEAEGRDRPGFEPLDADLLARLETVAVAAVVDALQRVVDLADQLALTVARAQLEAEFLFLRGAVVRVGEIRRFVLHMRDGAVHFDHEVAFPGEQDEAEVLELLLAHVLLAALDDVGLDVARSGEQGFDAVALFGVRQRRRCRGLER